MTAVLLTQPRIRFLDSNGAPLAGGKIYTYTAGTTTPKSTYTDSTAGTPNANPVILDSAGYADIWISGSYKIVVQDSAGNTISTTDNITGFATGAVGATFLDGSFTLQNTSDPTKQVVFNLAGVGTGNTIQIGVPNGNFTLISPSIAQTYTAAQREAIVTLTYGATITPDFSLANNFQLQLTGSPTVANPTNIVAGQSGNLAIYQDATGSRIITWGWGWMSPSGGSLPTLQTAGGSVDVLKYTVSVYNSGTATISLASPGVVTLTNHGFLLGQQVQIATTGALPTGLSTATTYYVIPIDANTFSLATSLVNAAAGTKINTSGSQSGVHTLTGLTIFLTSPLVKSQNVIYNAQSSTYAPASADNQALIDFTGSSNATWTLTSGTTLGKGWSATLRNNGSSQATLTLKSSAGTIDGIAAATGFVIYPGEERLVQCDGTNFNTFVLKGFLSTFTSSGTFTVPPGYQEFDCEGWGGGGGAGLGAQSGGGGGGGYNRLRILNAAMGSTQTITIGAGGTSSATSGSITAGGNSSVGSLLTCYGGGKGDTSGASAYAGGGGGGQTSVGSNAATTTGGAGGGPTGKTLTGAASTDGIGGGGGGSTTTGGGSSSMWGGGGGGAHANNGGSTIFGGGGGGGTTSGNGGTSVFGGAGGNHGAPGAVPGGGSGAGSGGTGGGAGQINIRGIV